MHAVSMSDLDHHPADAPRQARNNPVMVFNGDHPDAALIGLKQGGVLQAPGRHRCRDEPAPHRCAATGETRPSPPALASPCSRPVAGRRPPAERAR